MSDDRSIQTERDEILKLLEPLFEQAERENKWFKFAGDDNLGLIVFTPRELRAIHKLGQMIFGPNFWVLIDPVGGSKLQ